LHQESKLFLITRSKNRIFLGTTRYWQTNALGGALVDALIKNG